VNTRLRALLLPALILGTGCASNVYSRRGAPDVAPLTPTLTVRFAQPAPAMEAEALVRSGLFAVTTDPACPNVVRLEHMTAAARCGTPLIGSLLCLGLVPVNFAVTGVYRYELTVGGRPQSHLLQLPLRRRVSVWEWVFRPFHDEVEVVACELARAGSAITPESR
jgi:hypothetical protein